MTTDNCPSCNVSTDARHRERCDMACCSICGFQRFGCGHTNGDGGIWTGDWPGKVECREFGFYSRFAPGRGWEIARSDDEGAVEDLNTIYVKGAAGELVWNGVRWVVPDTWVGHR
jgi:hypothetical protein